MTRIAFLLAATALSTATPALADEASLQAEVAALKAQLAAQAERLDQVEARLQAAATTPAQPSAMAASTAASTSAVPASSAAAPVFASNASSGADTTIGGYGEISYNGYLKDRSRNQADLKRLVLFFGHRFNDKLSFTSEVEVEHAIASAGDEGEVAIEQAYLNYGFNPALNLKAGLFLMPFGFINRNHEPPVFYGGVVELRDIEAQNSGYWG